jgi:hypothetical protein
MNQQLLTGRMISARDWERYVNYPLIVCGFAVMALGARRDGRFARLARAAVITGLLSIAWILIDAQRSAYDAFWTDNAYSLAAVRALRAASAVRSDIGLVALDRPQLGPLVDLRAGRLLPLSIDYTDVFLNRLPEITAGNVGGSLSLVRPRLFRHLAVVAMSPGEFGRILRSEAASRSGWYLGFLFSLQDYWYPETDDRLVRSAEILESLPGVLAEYSAFLRKPRAPEAGTAIVVRSSPIEQAPSGLTRSETEVSRGAAGSGANRVMVRAFSQGAWR